jgi:hypothetical protein
MSGLLEGTTMLIDWSEKHRRELRELFKKMEEDTCTNRGIGYVEEV